MFDRNGTFRMHLRRYGVLYFGFAIFEIILFFFYGHDNLPNSFVDTLRDFTIALLTILIPFALAMFGNLLSVKSVDPEREFHKLDLHVMIDMVFQFKLLLIAVVIAFTSLLFMDSSSWFLFNFWVFSVGFIGRILINCYQWVKGQEWSFRLQYLKDNIISDDVVEVWKSVWNSKNIPRNYEDSMIEIYTRVIDEAVHDNPIQAQSLVGFLSFYVDDRYDYHLIKIFPHVLRWHWISYQKSNDDSDKAWQYDQSQYALQELIVKIQFRLAKSSLNSKFYKEIKIHIDKHRENREYCEILIRLIFDKLIEIIEHLDSTRNMWHGFPSDWKITVDNLKTTYESHQLLEIFIQWGWNRFNQTEQYDKVLADVAKNLFPDIEPITWATLLITFFVDDVRTAIKTPLGYGGSGRVYSGMVSDDYDFKAVHEAEEEQFRANTYQMAKYLYRYSNTARLEEDISILEHIGIQVDQYEEIRRQRLLRILRDLLAIQRGNDATVPEEMEE